MGTGPPHAECGGRPPVICHLSSVYERCPPDSHGPFGDTGQYPHQGPAGFCCPGVSDHELVFGPEARAALPANVQALINEALTTAGRNVMALFQDLISSTFRVARSMASMVLVPFLTFIS